MSDLIPILNRPIGDAVNAVDARELHRALGVGRDFSTWMRERIAEAQLNKGNDFEVLPESGENPGRPKMLWILTIDAAKSVSMLERTEKGREIRAYFIECEKRLRSQSATLDLRDPRSRLLALQQTIELLNESEAKVVALTAEVETKSEALAIAAPKVEIFDRFIDADGLYTLQNAGRALQQPPNLMIDALKHAKILVYQDGNLIAKAQYTHPTRGYFTHRPVLYTKRDGRQGTKPQIYVTQRGFTWLGHLIATGKLVVRSAS